MKIFFAVLALTIAVQANITDEQRAKLKQHKAACIASTGVKPELVEDSKTGKFADDASLNEFLFCMGKKIGFLNEAGEFQKDVIKQKVALGHGAAAADALVAACTTKTEATPQLTSLAFAKCLYEKSKSQYSIV